MSLHLSSPYQITKMVGELYCNFFQHHYDLPTVKARFFNSYGPGEVPGQYRNVIPNFIYLAMQGQPLPITGTGEETRDFTYVGDIVDGLLRAGYFDAAVGQEFNLASGAETRIIDLAEMINSQVGNKAGITFTARRKWDTKPRLLASVDRAKSLIGYQPNTPFHRGPEECHCLVSGQLGPDCRRGPVWARHVLGGARTWCARDKLGNQSSELNQ